MESQFTGTAYELKKLYLERHIHKGAMKQSLVLWSLLH